MPIQDEEFIKTLRATFKVEAEEHLQAISAMLLELEKSVSSESSAALIENVFREAHSLKGAARAVDFSTVEEVCQSLESIFSSWKRQETNPTADAFDVLHGAVDVVGGLLGSGESKKGEREPKFDDLIHSLGLLDSKMSSHDGNEAVHASQSLHLSRARTAASRQPPASQQSSFQSQSSVQPQSSIPPQPSDDSAPIPQSKLPSDLEKTAAETVRISISKLDARLLQAEEMLSIKAMMAQRTAELRELTNLFGQWQRDWRKAISVTPAYASQLELGPNTNEKSEAASLRKFLEENSDYFRSVGNRLNSLAAQTEKDRHTIGKHVDELLEDSKKLLMLPFSTITGIFPKLVRDLCRDQNKEADVIIRGGEVEIDKRILEEMKDILIHILRNSVDHGVEKSGDRARMNKPGRAGITIAASPINGHKVEIVVCDDGSGVDLEKVKSSAIRHGIITEADARNLTDSQALELIFHSEVSTSPIVTAISGRGLGMAIVRSKVEKLGGKISLESNRGAGTALRMVLPLTLATFRGILVSVADRIFVVPTVSIERVLRVRQGEIQTVENRETISLHGRPVSLARLAGVLELPDRPNRLGKDASLPVIVLNSGDHRIAFVVDELLHEQEVLVKPLRKPLVRVRNIGGATILGSGKVVPILNVADLIKSARKYGAAPNQAVEGSVQRQSSKKKVLVAEDSITSRMLLKGILESAGYQVKTAVDGVEAYTLLREGAFDLLVSDVEMPRMNGFDLTAKIRADKRLTELPVILVTALEQREERERGIDAGANAYIIKSSFDQSNLLEVMQGLI